jgi:hypothetical protein
MAAATMHAERLASVSITENQNEATLDDLCGLGRLLCTSICGSADHLRTLIAQVKVNGGTDTANNGTTCVKLTATVSAACTLGWVAIPNNNKTLIAAALQTKAMGTPVSVFYDTAGTSFHCPGETFTPCSVISIGIN